jgi:hypothetical protein
MRLNGGRVVPAADFNKLQARFLPATPMCFRVSP